MSQIQQNQYKDLTKGDYIAFFAMVVGMFMAVLDIQIVASSLSTIAAGLSATSEELSWIQTSYMIAEAIVIPITGFLARTFSTRITYTVAAGVFTLMSLLCACAWNIESMIFFRALQGLFGGAMIPTVFGAIFRLFSPEKRATAGIILGLTVTLAPTLGPTIGGYITEAISWRMMFLINILPGIFVCFAVWKFTDFDKPNLSLLNNFDFIGLILMAVGLGTLEYVLEEGIKYAWFESRYITYLTVLVMVMLAALIIREVRFHNPIICLRVFANRNFTMGCLCMFVLGVGLFGVVYMMPLFLYRIAGLDTLQIGIVMIVTGGAQFFGAPIAGRLVASGFDKRIILAIGLMGFAIGCNLNGKLTPESGFYDFLFPQIFRGAFLMFCFIPLNEMVLGSLLLSDVQNGSGLYNLTRNVGGAVGLAVINTTIIDNTKIFSSILGEHMSKTNPTTQYYQSMIQNMFENSLAYPELASLSFMNNIIMRDGFIIALNDMFLAISILIVLCLFMVPFFEIPKQKLAAEMGGH
ncbi:MAG: Multidrug resistance protein [Pseudomonadota bacterium]|jgi:DHA2 family multidrug resistance protein